MDVYNERQPTAFIGIDWADKKHAFHVFTSDGECSEGHFDQQPQAIDQWIAQLRQQFPHHALAIILEQSKGALTAALMKYDELSIYPINPGQLAKYRESMNYSGCKDDPTDAELLAQFLMHYQDRLRVLRPDSPATRKLAMLTEHRRGLVEQRNALANELTAVLKQYFPLLIDFKAAKPYARFLCRLLLKWPTLAKLQRAKPDTIRRFFHKLNIRKHVETRVAMIGTAVPLTEDAVLIDCLSRRAVWLAKSILVLSDAIDEYDESIEETLMTHEDRRLFASLPGAAKLTQSRLIAAMGTQRDRFANCKSLQSSSGIAPVTKESGNSRVVYHRWACPKFIKQTFHEYAGQSIGFSLWAKAYYHMQLSRGKKPNLAKRALAYKWQRIIFRCWQDRVPYDEDKYLERLKVTGSPILDFIAA